MKKIDALIIDSGGRGDALAWKVSKSPLIRNVYVAPGNDGIARRPGVTCLPKIKSTELAKIKEFVETMKVGLTIFGQEDPLADGAVDMLEGFNVVGPKKAAAEIEWSKAWAKEFMKRYGIPTARFEKFSDPEKARKYALANMPCFVKADGLAFGKAALPGRTKEEVLEAIERIMVKKEFGAAGNWAVVEELLLGREATFMVLTDGWTAIPLLPTEDHKPVFDGDQGANTGGLGAIAPTPVITPSLTEIIMKTIILPTLAGLHQEGTIYRGFLYAGLIMTESGPKVLEFNCRPGDPEIQPLVMLMEDDIVPVFLEISEGKLTTKEIRWSKGAAACVVMASRGYPGDYEKNKTIFGLERAFKVSGVEIFCAGIKKEDEFWKTNGGRVLGITATGETLEDALTKIYHDVIPGISWMSPVPHFRTDIGRRPV